MLFVFSASIFCSESSKDNWPIFWHSGTPLLVCGGNFKDIELFIGWLCRWPGGGIILFVQGVASFVVCSFANHSLLCFVAVGVDLFSITNIFS